MIYGAKARPTKTTTDKRQHNNKPNQTIQKMTQHQKQNAL